MGAHDSLRRWMGDSVTVDTVEEGSRGELQPGFGWVQFCITTDEDLDAVKMEWSRVVKNS